MITNFLSRLLKIERVYLCKKTYEEILSLLSNLSRTDFLDMNCRYHWKIKKILLDYLEKNMKLD